MDYNNWKWTDLMSGDKIKVARKARNVCSWALSWNNKVLEVVKIEQCGNYYRLWIKNNGRTVYFPITESGCYYNIGDIRHRNIQLFDIIELVEDK